MVPAPSSGATGRFRRIARRYRFVVLLPLLFALAGVVYLNLVGLPDFLKRPLLKQLHAHGLKLEFDRLRLRWDRGLVGERVVLAESREADGPEVVFDEVVLEPDWGRLLRFKFELRSLRLHDGSITFPLDRLEPSASPFRVDAVQAELRFLEDDRWELARFTAEGLGLSLEASGSLTNASAVRDWGDGAGTRDRAASLAAWKAHLQRANAYARHCRFGRPPRVFLVVAGDARDPAGIRAEVRLEAESIESKWGTLHSVSLRSELNRPTESAGVGRSDVTADFRQAQTAWGAIQQGHWELRWTQAFTNSLPEEVQWQLALEQVASPWGEIPHTQFEVRAYPDPANPGQLVGELSATSDAILGGLARAETNRLTAVVRLDPVTYLPSSGEYQFSAVNARFEAGTARAIDLRGAVRVRDRDAQVVAGPDWAWWAALAPFELSCHGRIDELALRTVHFDTVEFEANWQAPQLSLTRLRVDRGGEQLTMRGEVDVATREAAATANLNLDAHALEPLLTPKAVRWLSQYGWQQPPQVEAAVDLVLPEWKPTQPNPPGALASRLWLRGHVAAGPATYRGLQADSVDLQFSLFESSLAPAAARGHPARRRTRAGLHGGHHHQGLSFPGP